MSESVNRLKPVQRKLSFKIERHRGHQVSYIQCEHAEASAIDALKDQLGFASRSTVLRWIFAHLESENHLSRWTLEMLSKKKPPTTNSNQDGTRRLS